jgi:hypothetical protein
MNLREEFEDKFVVTMMIHQLHGKIVFCSVIGRYKKIITNQGGLTGNEELGLSWLNGAWFMFQELNKEK